MISINTHIYIYIMHPIKDILYAAMTEGPNWNHPTERGIPNFRNLKLGRFVLGFTSLLD